jgi:acetoin utilization deacetylase AcuC-like enzyme
MWHDTGSQANFLPAGGMTPIQPYFHVENPDTKRRLKNLLDVLGVTPKLTAIEPRMATVEDLELFHTPDYIRNIKSMSDGLGGDAGMLTPFAPGGFEIAQLSAGGAMALVDAVIDGTVTNGYALNRPPGHHAEPDSGGGFCIFGNVAIAVKHARQRRGVGRVAIVDWDVHHGNGTQTAFYEDPSVLTISIHQTGCFPPGSGPTSENGAGAAAGTNININMPPGCGHAAYLMAFEEVVAPALQRFNPDLIVVAAGYDSGGMDPLSRILNDGETFRNMTRMVKAVADEVCGGKLAVVHEGGYSAAHVPFCGLAVVEEISGITTGVTDPFQPILGGMGGYELLDHHKAAVKEAAALVPKVPGK